MNADTHESLLREWFYANTDFDMNDWNRRVRSLLERDDYESDIENNPPLSGNMAGPL